MILPIIIGFGLIAVLVITDRGKHRSDSWVVGWLIILLAVGLVAWSLIPEMLGFKEGIYR